MIPIDVCTIGTFDLLHAGHVRLFKRAAMYGDLTVGVNSDEFVLSYKGSLPSHSWDRRAAEIATIPCVDRVVKNGDNGRTMLQILKPDILVVGSDWLEKDYLAQLNLTHDELVDLDIEVLFVPRTPGVSSTERRRDLDSDAETDMSSFEDAFKDNPNVGGHLHE